MRTFFIAIAMALIACNPGSQKVIQNENQFCQLLDSFYLQHKTRWNTKGLHEDVSKLEKASGVNSLVDCGNHGCLYDTIPYLISDYVIWAKKLKCRCLLPDSVQQRVIRERVDIVAERRKRAIPIELQ